MTQFFKSKRGKDSIIEVISYFKVENKEEYKIKLRVRPKNLSYYYHGEGDFKWYSVKKEVFKEWQKI